MWPLWPEVAPHYRNLFGQMQAESFEISKRSPPVTPGTAFAQSSHGHMALMLDWIRIEESLHPGVDRFAGADRRQDAGKGGHDEYS
jgi:hypothetical protein